MPLDIESRKVAPDITVLEIKGRITLGRDTKRIESLVQQLRGESVSKLVFDLTGVNYVDSSGLGTLTQCYAVMREVGGGFRLAGATGRVLQLLRYTQLDKILPVFPTVAEACQDF